MPKMYEVVKRAQERSEVEPSRGSGAVDKDLPFSTTQKTPEAQGPQLG